MNPELTAQIRNKLTAPKTLIELLSQGKDVPKEFIEKAKKSLDEAMGNVE